jgi:hypothetical protein
VGQVINGTNGWGPVAGLEVALIAYSADGSETTGAAQTDAEGSFHFTRLSTARGNVYQAIVDYQGATYRGKALSFAAGRDALSAEIVVYGATESDVALSIERAHVVIDLTSDGLAVAETLVVRNDGDETYVGSGPEVTPGKAATLRFSLPPGAELIDIGESLMDCCVAATVDGFVDTMPVMPGTRAVLYMYTVPYSERAFEMRRVYAYPTDRMDVFLSGAAIQVDVLGFSRARAVEGYDVRYERWTGGRLLAGEQVIVRLVLGHPLWRRWQARQRSTRQGSMKPQDSAFNA